MESPFPLFSLSTAGVSTAAWEGDEAFSMQLLLADDGLSPALQEAFLESPGCRVTSF